MPEVIGLALRGLHQHFVDEEQSDPSIMSVDSSLMHAHGNVWHKKQRDKGRTALVRQH